jgi:hypothetical protein
VSDEKNILISEVSRIAASVHAKDASQDVTVKFNCEPWKTYTRDMSITSAVSQQQQQQHSLLSQASWGRLEMKPKRDEKHGDT